MAEAAAKGVTSESEVEARLVRAAQAGATEVLDADGYIFATPENLAAMSGMMKDFFDRPITLLWTASWAVPMQR